jgi:hypothetical protein
MMGELWLHRRWHNNVSSVQGYTVLGIVPQCQGWMHRAGDGWTGPEMAAQGDRGDMLCSPCVTRLPDQALGRWSCTLGGYPKAPSGGTTWRKDESRHHSDLK